MPTSLVYHGWGAVGYDVIRVKYDHGQVTFHLRTQAGRLRCSSCASGDVVRAGLVPRFLRAAPIGDRAVFLALHLHRVSCKACGALGVEQIRIADPRKSYTKRLAQFVLMLCRFCALAHVAQITQLAWGSVKEILRANLERRSKHVSWKGLKYIAIDEISYGRGQNKYLTVVMDLMADRVVYVHEGRDQESLAPFFKKLRRQKVKLKAVAMDMHEPYRLSLERYYKRPCAIVHDRFHVMKLLNEHVDGIRRDEIAKAKDDGSKRYIKGQRYILLRANENLTKDGKKRLKALMAANKVLSTAYILKEDFRAIWGHTRAADGAKALRDWMAQVEASGLARLQKFVKTLEDHWKGVISYFTHRITTGPLEGLNNAIKVLKRKAYGFRDIAFFKLRILFIHECRRDFAGT